MVSITIDNFKDRESMAVYELPEGSSVLDLKTEIEATEGIPIGHQRLAYWKKASHNTHGIPYQIEDLQDNENLDFLILNHLSQSEPTIRLLQARIRLHLRNLERQDTVESYTLSDYQEKIILQEVDLDENIRTSLLLWQTVFIEAVDPSSVRLFFLNSGQDLISILDIDQTFSYYGICNDDAIHIVSETVSDRRLSMPTSYLRQHSLRATSQSRLPGRQLTAIVLKAKYNWDGKIMHPFIEGLPLKRNKLFKVSSEKFETASEWLYGIPLNPTVTSPLWLRLPCFTAKKRVKERAEGYFPKTFVSTLDELGDNIEITDDMLDIPPLPPFQFPPAKSMTFHMPISDKGHSFLKMTANYELLSSPVDPTHVTIKLLCSTHDIRRVSSVSLFIETPETEILDVQVRENEAHREEIHIDKEVTESRSRQTHFDGVNIGTHGTTVGFQGGMSRGHSIGSTEKGSRVSRRKVDAGVYNDNTIFWNLKAPTTRLDEDGLTGEESVMFTLTHKPVRFKYRCRVTHSRGGVEKTTQRVSRA